MDVGGTALGFEEICNLRGGIVAEKLSEGFLVEGDAMLFDERDEIRGSEAGESGFGEVRIPGEKIFRSGMDVGEVAATTAGDEDFFADAVGVLEYGHPTAAFAGLEAQKRPAAPAPRIRTSKERGRRTSRCAKASLRQREAGRKLRRGRVEG